jgi:hypothetical protein
MKLINHQKDNHYELSCSMMWGTIYMTTKEWTKCYLWLWSQWQKAIKDIETYKRDSLSSLNKNENLKWFCIGVEATRLLAEKNNLKNYKNQNYGIKIID